MIVVFVVALLSAVVVGMIQINTEEIQLMQNHVNIAQAFCIAEAGVEDAIRCLRADKDWDDGFTDKAFATGRYTVQIKRSTITSTGTTAARYQAKMVVDVTVSGSTSPYKVTISAVRINP
ncbi:MAG: hypothetical protein QHH07_02030 [Sedimentisphaerales bacterium]|nr:hypothetical protein [Sedimentisphaerales bacterium]